MSDRPDAAVGSPATLEERRGEQLRGLADVALALGVATEMDDVLAMVTRSARDLVDVHESVTSRLPHGSTEGSSHVALSHVREQAPPAAPGKVGLPAGSGIEQEPDALVVPLVARDGRDLGALRLRGKADGTPFTQEDEAIVVQLAQMASASIENAELIERERSARREAQRQARAHRVLSEASHAFSMSLDLDQTLSTVSRTMVPEFADWAGVTLFGSSGQLELAASAALDPSLDRRLRGLVERSLAAPDPAVGAAATVRTGSSQLHTRITDDLLGAGTSRALPRDAVGLLDGASALVVPLPARGRNLGSLTAIRMQCEPYGRDDLGFAEDLARRAALAVENATSYELERHAADMLLRNLLPRELPIAADIATGVRYRPGAAGARIGGDWYDVFPIAEGTYALVVGDVMGHGVAAASAMGQMRSAVRAYALEGHPPRRVLDRLDSLVQRLDEMALTTCVYATFDSRRRVLTVASAGHLPPLVVGPGPSASLAAVPSGLPLGVGLIDTGYAEHEIELAEGATFLLYTDGLVETRTASIDEGLERLRSAASEHAHRTPQQLCDALLDALADPDHHDDIALLAVQVGRTAPPVPPEDDDELDVAGVALLLDRRSPAHARAFVRERLLAWGSRSVLDEVMLMTSELVTNAQLHGAAPLDVRVRRLRRGVRVEVEDGSDRMPTVHDYGLEAGTGRGMLLLHSLASRWGTEPTPGGKVVWFEVHR